MYFRYCYCILGNKNHKLWKKLIKKNDTIVFMLKDRLLRALSLTNELFENMDSKALDMVLENLPSNSIRGQVWCIIGARESFDIAIQESEWKGFGCSLEDDDGIENINNKLKATTDSLLQTINQELDEKRKKYTFDLLEHEIQHHGQLIRYIYANKMQFPKSWHTRYTV